MTLEERIIGMVHQAIEGMSAEEASELAGTSASSLGIMAEAYEENR